MVFWPLVLKPDMPLFGYTYDSHIRSKTFSTFLILGFRRVLYLICFLLGNSRASEFFIHLPMKMELIEGSETSAIRTQTPGNYQKENILHSVRYLEHTRQAMRILRNNGARSCYYRCSGKAMIITYSEYLSVAL